LERFYEPTSGAVRIGGVDIQAMEMADYRSGLVLVQQNPKLFSADIAYNIAYGEQSRSLPSCL
jgi:ATP-binding cassette subfamily B protein